MKKLSLALMLLISSTQAYAFPNMKNYNHHITYAADLKTYYMKFKDKVKLQRVKSKDFDGWRGFCNLTKYKILITIKDDMEDSKCLLILNNDKDYEISTFTEIVDKGDDIIAIFYEFSDEGRVVFLGSKSEKEFIVLWQTFDQGNN